MIRSPVSGSGFSSPRDWCKGVCYSIDILEPWWWCEFADCSSDINILSFAAFYFLLIGSRLEWWICLLLQIDVFTPDIFLSSSIDLFKKKVKYMIFVALADSLLAADEFAWLPSAEPSHRDPEGPQLAPGGCVGCLSVVSYFRSYVTVCNVSCK